jgi:recombination protein RecT
MTTTSIDKIARGEKPETPLAKFSGFLDKLKPQMALALPRHMNADRMARLALTQFSTNPKLQECDPMSIAGAIITASQLGLEIGHAYLIPYKGRATLVPGWRGLVDLANRSGRTTVWTGAVFEGDEFDYALGDTPFVKHRPGDDTDDPNKLLFVYAIGRVNGSQHAVIDVWRMPKVWRHRDVMNKVGKAHYSYAHPEMYARKLPLLQVLKYMPSSIELSRAAHMSEVADSGEGMVIDGDFVTAMRTDDGSGGVDPDTGEISGGSTGGSGADPSKGAPPAGIVKTMAQWKAEISKAHDKDSAAMTLDTARETLDGADLATLAAHYRATWEQS